MVVRRGGLYLGIILILLGGLFLLRTLGVIQASFWGLLWPIIIIGFGVWGVWSALNAGRPAPMEHVSVPVEGASRARLVVHYAAGRLRIRGGAGPGELLVGDFGGGLEYSAKREGDLLLVDLRRPQDSWVFLGMPWMWGQSAEWSFQVANDVPLVLRLEAGASDGDIDLTEARVTELSLQTGASSTILTLPARAGQVRAEIEAGAASVHVKVPEGVAARIRGKGGLSEIVVDRKRFPRVGNVYLSGDYEGASNRVDLDIQAGVGTVRVG